jgi:small conductance mechanosensitive channel
MQTVDLDKLAKEMIDLILKYGPDLLFAILTLVIGYIIIGRIIGLLRKISVKRDLDPTLTSFLLSLTSISLKLILIITFISMLGFETTSLLAVLAAASFAVGLALQGSLSNFAGGVLIILFKPYSIGDYIEAQGFTGSVKSIQIFNTVLTTPDNKTIIIPNGAISNGPITNYSTQDKRRVDFTFGIGYDDDFEQAKGIINDIIAKDNRILKDPGPLVRVKELGASSVDITARVWVKKEDYWAVYFDMIESVKSEFDAQGISFPYPQTDVHLYKE